MVEPPQRPSAGAMGHHPRCFARNISSPKGAIKKQQQKTKEGLSGQACTVAVALEQMRHKSSQYQSDEPVECEGCGGVVGAVVEGRNVRVVPVVVSLLKERPARGVQCPNRLHHTSTALAQGM